MGMSLDGYIATSDGLPSLLQAPDFVPGKSHGYPEFIAGCDTVVMGRQTFLPAISALSWPWRDLQVFVLTSRPLPPETPNRVVTARGGPAGLVQQLRSRGSDADVHLVGGPHTIQAIYAEGALDRLELVLLPIILGDGIPLWPSGAARPLLHLIGEPRMFPDGAVELCYSTG